MNESPESSPPPPPAPSQPITQLGSSGSQMSNSMMGMLSSGNDTGYGDSSPQYNNRSGSVGSDLYGTSPGYGSTYLASRYATSTIDPSTPRYSTYYSTLQPQHMMMTSMPSGSATAAATLHQIQQQPQQTQLDHVYYTPGARYGDYFRHHHPPAASYAESTSPRWRRRSYDYEGNSAVGPGTSATMMSDYRRSMHSSRPMTDISARSRSRSRIGGGDYESAYLRYQSPTSSVKETTYTMPSAAATTSTTLGTRPMSGYIYGHSYGSGYHVGSTLGIDTTSAPGMQPHPPPGYNAKDREVSARIRRYQQPES